MLQEKAKVVSLNSYKGEYRLLCLYAPVIAGLARPGQFVHLRVPMLEASVLRRPFSIYRVEGSDLYILFKKVGIGTGRMVYLAARDEVSIIGPLGNGYPDPDLNSYPVLVAGGYGVAPLVFLAERMKAKGTVFIGAADANGILCEEDFQKLGWDIRICTEDGSLGSKGRATDVLKQWIAEEKRNTQDVEYFVCGPDGMLNAMANLVAGSGSKAWLSLDRHMGCGVGACLACVHKIRQVDGSEVWQRVCRDGPIFEAASVVWGDGSRKI